MRLQYIAERHAGLHLQTGAPFTVDNTLTMDQNLIQLELSLNVEMYVSRVESFRGRLHFGSSSNKQRFSDFVLYTQAVCDCFVEHWRVIIILLH